MFGNNVSQYFKVLFFDSFLAVALVCVEINFKRPWFYKWFGLVKDYAGRGVYVALYFFIFNVKF